MYEIVRVVLLPMERGRWEQLRALLQGALIKGHPQIINMDEVLQQLTKPDQRRVLSGLGFETPVNANCGCFKNIVRLGDPRSPSDITQQHLLFTPFCKTFTAEARLHGQTVWQSSTLPVYL